MEIRAQTGRMSARIRVDDSRTAEAGGAEHQSNCTAASRHARPMKTDLRTVCVVVVSGILLAGCSGTPSHRTPLPGAAADLLDYVKVMARVGTAPDLLTRRAGCPRC